MATTNEAKLAAVLDLALAGLKAVALHLRRTGTEEGNDAAARVMARVEAAEKILFSGGSGGGGK